MDHTVLPAITPMPAFTLAAKLLIGSKKARGCKNGTDPLNHHAKYGGDHGSRADCRRKSVMFFLFVFCLSVFLSHYGMT